MNNGYKAIEKIYENVIRIVDKKIANLYSDKEAIIVSENEDSYTVLIDSYTQTSGTPRSTLQSV